MGRQRFSPEAAEISRMSQSPSVSVSRRGFLRGRASAPDTPPAFRPPWSDEQRLNEHCTSCGACVDACETTIISIGPDKKPQVSFELGECTFCKACVTACDEPIFNLDQVAPWRLGVLIGDSCLLKVGVTCQLCTDQCDAQALRLDLRVRPAGAIQIDQNACTGCGACIAPCPVSAIDMINPQQEAGT